MDWLWISLGILLALAGIAGSLLPVLPGPPIAYIGMLIQQFRSYKPFGTTYLILMAGLVVLVAVLDYLVPLWGTRRFGGSRFGVWGCTLGFLAAFWLGPWGIILGPFLGAFIGELIANKGSAHALKAAFGSFVGFLLGSLVKIIACAWILYAIVDSV